MTQENLFSRYNLPPLYRAPPDSIIFNTLQQAKVLTFAERMPIEFSRIISPEQYTRLLKNEINSGNIGNIKTCRDLIFDGSTAKKLNQFIEDSELEEINIKILSSELVVDESIRLPRHIKISGNDVRLVAESVDIAIIVQGQANIEIANLNIIGPRKCGIMILGSTQCYVNNVTVTDSQGYGIILRHSSHLVTLQGCSFKNNLRSGIMLQDSSHHCYISDCEVSGIHHSSNWAAGIVITALESVSEFGIEDAFEENYFYPKDLSLNINAVPHQNIIEGCHVYNNQSSGIYIDGGNGNVVIGNLIHNNDKEGLCLDFYAAVNLILSNTLDQNGNRQYQSDHDLQIDCVLEFGRLADGSSTAKLPNMSLDNAGYNLILKNSISNAAGDGIKIVRAGFRNIFGLNSIADNNCGHNSVFNFSGVLFGSAGCELENDTSGLDRLPSIENIIFGNIIYGSHANGIVYDMGSTYNDTIDNMVMKYRNSAILENAYPNSLVGNNFSGGSQSNIRSLYMRIKVTMKSIFYYSKSLFNV